MGITDTFDFYTKTLPFKIEGTALIFKGNTDIQYSSQSQNHASIFSLRI